MQHSYLGYLDLSLVKGLQSSSKHELNILHCLLGLLRQLHRMNIQFALKLSHKKQGFDIPGLKPTKPKMDMVMSQFSVLKM